MKYAILTYSQRPMRYSGTLRLNLGDPIQTYAMKYLYSLMDINHDDIIEISRYHSKNYIGEYVVLPYNCFNRIYNQSGYEYGSLPLSPKIIPVYMSFHLHSRFINEGILNNLKQYQPIGCRDEETMTNMRNHGIMAYLSGCITALLPKREETPNGGKVFFVDIPDSLKAYIPEELKKNSELTGHHVVFERSSQEDYMVDEEYNRFYNLGISQLQKYKKEARLVVTSRLHAASPCMAMGIPVILVNDSFDGRFSWIDKYLPLYTKDKYNEINWYPKAVDYEHEKKKLTKFFIQEITKTYNNYKDFYDVSLYYENRSKYFYNSELVISLNNLPFAKKEHIKYAVWGITTLAETLKNVIEDNYKGWQFTFAIDKTCNGIFEGKTVKHPRDISQQDKEIIYFVIPNSAHNDAMELLSKLKISFVLVNKMHMDYYEIN